MQIVITILRTDKLLECTHSFVSDHVGYKFVEPVQFDLGRVFSKCEASQPLLYLTTGMNEATMEITKFALDRGKTISVTSMGDVSTRLVEKQIEECQSSGKDWLLLENFELARDKDILLQNHSRLEEEFNPGYRLWIVTKECEFPSLQLRKSLKLTWEYPCSIRESMLSLFQKGPIKSAKCWTSSNDRNQQMGSERHASRMMYCLGFLHAIMNERSRYGVLGGWSHPVVFTSHDVSIAVHYLEMIIKEFDTIPFQGIFDLLCDCGYANAFSDKHDKKLLQSILTTCINERVLSTNRYRFSAATDYFVPNKTLYRDYVEFIKDLPSRSDHDVLDLDPSCQLRYDFQRGVDFLCKITKVLLRGTLERNLVLSEIVSSLLDDLQEVSKQSGFPEEDDTLSWVWLTEIESHKKLISVAFSQLKQLERCIKGEKVMDNESLKLSQILMSGEVPSSWSGTKYKKTVAQYLDIIKIRFKFYQNSCKGSISFRGLVKPELLLKAIQFQFASEHNLAFEDVGFAISFGKNDADLISKAYAFTDLVLQGASLNMDRDVLVDRRLSLEKNLEIPFTYFTPIAHIAKHRSTEGNFECPLYGTPNRLISNAPNEKESSFITYLTLRTDVSSQDLLIKRATMLFVKP